MTNSLNIAGLRTGKLVAIKECHKEGRYWLWECLCDCGQTALFPNRYIKKELVSNCGRCASSTRKNAVYIGEKSVNKEGYTAEVTGFISASPSIFLVRFVDEFMAEVQVRAGNFKSGSFSNPYHKSVACVGYFGVGKFIAKVGGKHTTEYADWNSMLKRCYVAEESKKSYKDKEVCKEWHNFQVFSEWATNQENFGRTGWDLEKDLLIKGNNVYSPETCVYLPREINSFIKRKNCNGLPLGVDIAYNYDGTPYYRVQARECGNNIYLGRYYIIEEAFMAYKQHKEGLAKELAKKWKDQIPPIAFNALYNYTVDITD